MAEEKKTCQLCFRGDEKICLDVQGFSLFAEAEVTTEDLDVKGHPNAMPFKGTLLLVDQASNKPPQGADGHLIYVPREVAEKRLTSLVGMAVNFVSSADRHAPQRKVGVVTAAWLDGNKAKVEGVIWSKDFPKEAQEIKANSPRLGMSMELADVWVEDKLSRVWKLQDFYFTGGTILLKNAAAYYQTSLNAAKEERKQFYVRALAAASAVVEGKIPEGGEATMPDKNKSKPPAKGDNARKLIAQIAAATAVGVSANLKEVIEAQTAILGKFASHLSVLANAVKKQMKSKADPSADPSRIDPSVDMSAASEVEADELTAALEEATKDVRAKKNDSSEDDLSNEDDPSEEGDPSLDAALDDPSAEFTPTGTDSSGGSPDDASSEPGNVNKSANKKQSKNSRRHLHAAAEQDSGGHLVEQLNAMAEENEKLKENQDKLVKGYKKQKGLVAQMQAQIDNFTEHMNRKSVSPELSMVLAKGNFSAADLMSADEKLTVEKVDQLFAACAAGGLVLGPTERMHLKNQMLQLNLIETGEIVRQ